MTGSNLPRTAWRKSTHSGGVSNCVEVAARPPLIVAVRDSKDPATPAMTVARGAWDDFTASVKSGNYDTRR